ncbi:MAG: YkgJ family cysteine cluster protein [Deltaproteobacteria bacterium]|nr:YkgJ family cysteine cluster protein [Deltaproteobacteria bacterium]
MTQERWHKLLHFNCTGCGNCCRDTVVCLTDADIQRIVDGTGKAVSSFVQFYDDDGVALAASSPFWVPFSDKPAVMGLRSTRGHCVFLDGENRCTIYEHRPVTCRQHPFDVQLSETGAVTRVSISRVVECPHDWTGKLTRRGLRTLLCWNDRQVTRYFAKIRQWKRMRDMSKTPRAFLRFLGFAT